MSVSTELRFTPAPLRQPGAVLVESPLPAGPPRHGTRPARGPVARIEAAEDPRSARGRQAYAAARDGEAQGQAGRNQGERLGRAEALVALPADGRFAAVHFTAQLLGQTSAPETRPRPLVPVSHGHEAYRRAGAEPPLFSGDPVVLSLSA